ncbi:hypothetical protein ATL51_3302 [Pseudonocardia alni]|uniref:Uncharacterized protein n=1 Tax=Pseudonocardia alni TaxID=33907 RepID=A0AA44UQU4_PSEA5|nr:hypothetical protein ATL51_3302 [Pseudonocardia alni]
MPAETPADGRLSFVADAGPVLDEPLGAVTDA